MKKKGKTLLIKILKNKVSISALQMDQRRQRRPPSTIEEESPHLSALHYFSLNVGTAVSPASACC